MPRVPLPSLFQILVPIVVVALTGPLIALAGITTGVAAFLLWLRVQLVYLDMTIAVVVSWVVALVTPRRKGPSAATKHYTAQNEARLINPNVPPMLYSGDLPGFSTPSVANSATARPRSRQSVASSIGSQHSDSYTSLLLTTAPADRDYEGVGGWRTTNNAGDTDDDDEIEDNTWSSLNARLELPTVTSSPSLAALVQGGAVVAATTGNNSRESMQSSGAGAAAGAGEGSSTAGGTLQQLQQQQQQQQQQRCHVRSLTGGSATSYSLKMSPVLGRSPVLARSPAANMMRDHSAAEGYFSPASLPSAAAAATSGAGAGASGGGATHGAPSSTRRSSIGLFMSGLGGGDKKKAKSLHGDG